MADRRQGHGRRPANRTGLVSAGHQKRLSLDRARRAWRDEPVATAAPDRYQQVRPRTCRLPAAAMKRWQGVARRDRGTADPGHSHRAQRQRSCCARHPLSPTGQGLVEFHPTRERAGAGAADSLLFVCAGEAGSRLSHSFSSLNCPAADWGAREGLPSDAAVRCRPSGSIGRGIQ